MVRSAARSSFGITAKVSWQKAELSRASPPDEGAVPVARAERHTRRSAPPAPREKGSSDVVAEGRAQAERKPADQNEPLDTDREVDAGEDRTDRLGALPHDRGGPFVLLAVG